MMTFITRRDAIEAVRTILQFIGEDPLRDGLIDTPSRVIKALQEMTVGYQANLSAILSTNFEVEYDDLVLVTGIKFTSLCEHHMLPFTGTANVGYIPRDKVVGLSKIPRTVLAYAKRLQVQERLTNQIGFALMEQLLPNGVGVAIKAHHHCMSCRGVGQADAAMITRFVSGAFRDNQTLQSKLIEF